MAALSPHSEIGGMYSFIPWRSACLVNVSLSPLLAATPPANVIVLYPLSKAALINFEVSISHAVC